MTPRRSAASAAPTKTATPKKPAKPAAKTATAKKRPPNHRPRRVDWQEVFLESYSTLGVITGAAQSAGVSPDTVQRRRLDDAAFAARFALAHDTAVDKAELRLVEYAQVGVRTTRRTTRKGELVEEVEVIKPSVTALIVFLKANRPEKYRENVRVEQSGPDGGPIQIESIDVLDAKIAQLAEEVERRAAREEAA